MHSVGKKILTKMPFVNDPEDITNQYKYPEDSPEERASKIQANQKSTEPQILTSGEKVLEFELDQEEPSYYGENFDVRLKISNKSEKARTVGGIINIYSIYYTGILGDKIKSHEFKDLEVQKESEEYITISASIEDYDDKLVEYCHIETSYLCTVQEVDQFYAGSDSFLLQKPELTMKVPSEVKVFEFYNVEVSFTNPLDKTLTNCKLNLESPNLQRSLKIDIRNVKAKETYMMSVPLYAGYKPGSRTIIANFDSKELVDITGRCQVKIIE